MEKRFKRVEVPKVISEPDSASPESSSPEGIIPPTPAEAAPVVVPGAPPPPPHEAVEAARELTQDAPASEQIDSHASQADEPEPIEEEEPDLPFAAPLELIDETIADEDLKFDWFILKVQVNREDSIKDALWRRVKMNGLERYFKEIIVPTEDVIEFTKTGKKRVVKKKLYPGYILVNMAVSDESWFVVRETSGIGDFTGSAGKPTPMEPKDVERILRSSKVLPEEEGAGVKTAIPFKTGDRVRVKEGYFQNFEGDVHAIDQAHGRVTVMINIFGRATPVEIEHWQIEAV
jgi:transcription termination/antitermination protein NusG